MCRWSRGRGCRLRRHKSARGVVHSGDGAEGDEDEDDDDGYGCVGVGSCQRGRTPNDDRTRRFRAWCRHVYASTWYVTARGRGGGSARQHHPACPLALYVADIIATRPPTFLVLLSTGSTRIDTSPCQPGSSWRACGSIPCKWSMMRAMRSTASAGVRVSLSWSCA